MRTPTKVNKVCMFSFRQEMHLSIFSAIKSSLTEYLKYSNIFTVDP